MLQDRVAIVTGAASGIGRATALALAREGATVVAADRDEAGLSATAALADGRAWPFQVDVADEGQVATLAERVVARFSRIDILVHCAGILRGGAGAPRAIADTSPEEWDRVLRVNLRGTFLCNRAVLPAMLRQREGQIVNLSSTSGRRGRALDGPYCASKFGVIGLTESLAEEVRTRGIKVLAILPDAVDTPLWKQNGPVAVPKDSLAPERVADLILYVLNLPRDTILDHLTISAFRTRRYKDRLGLSTAAGEEATAAADPAGTGGR